MRQNVLLVALSALTVASAQNYSVDPNSIDASTKSDWCNAEYNTCDTLCGKAWTANDCNVNTLQYTCTCSNGSAPGLQYYTQTMPSFLCQKRFSLCIAANTGSQKAQDECKSNILSQCGTLDPSKVQVSQSSGTATPTTAASGSQTSTGGQNAASTSTSKAGAAPTNAAYIGNGVAMVAAGVFAALL